MPQDRRRFLPPPLQILRLTRFRGFNGLANVARLLDCLAAWLLGSFSSRLVGDLGQVEGLVRSLLTASLGPDPARFALPSP